ncbi:MAG: type I pantothenate kinase [Propionibacteriaceae bacterium]|nr:type I pantothenate kinase [Propionibacteriaceae bacterium]
MTPRNPPTPAPFVRLPRAAWADLAAQTSVVLNQATIDKLRGIGDPTNERDVLEVYHPLAELIGRFATGTAQLGRDTGAFLELPVAGPPFILGIAGSVAVGKSTVARLVAELLRRSPGHPRVDLVTTDSFLLSNAELAARGLSDRKGFPASYDMAAMLKFVVDVKTGLPEVSAPRYSHIIYDIVPGETQTIEHPDILVLEGLNVLQPPNWHGAGGDPVVSVSDFVDFSVYVDADEQAIRSWFIERFLTLRATAFADPSSFFRQYAGLGDDEAAKMAGQVWDGINGLNLREHIAPTQTRATVILRKDDDHRVESVLIRRV